MLGKCVECGKLARSSELKFLHQDMEHFCTKGCILKGLERLRPETPELPAGAIPVPEGITQPDFAYSTLLNQGFRSAYELHVAEWMFDADIDFTYEQFYFDLPTSTYTPDFYLPYYGVFVEVKGVWSPGKKSKMSRFLRQYPDVNLMLISWAIKYEFYPVN